MSPKKATPKLAHPAIFINCTQDEHDAIHSAVAYLAKQSGLKGSVSTWARAVLIREAWRVINKENPG